MMAMRRNDKLIQEIQVGLNVHLMQLTSHAYSVLCCLHSKYISGQINQIIVSLNTLDRDYIDKVPLSGPTCSQLDSHFPNVVSLQIAFLHAHTHLKLIRWFFQIFLDTCFLCGVYSFQIFIIHGNSVRIFPCYIIMSCFHFSPPCKVVLHLNQ